MKPHLSTLRWAGLADRLVPILKFANSPFSWPNSISTHPLLVKLSGEPQSETLEQYSELLAGDHTFKLSLFLPECSVLPWWALTHSYSAKGFKVLSVFFSSREKLGDTVSLCLNVWGWKGSSHLLHWLPIEEGHKIITKWHWGLAHTWLQETEKVYKMNGFWLCYKWTC